MSDELNPSEENFDYLGEGELVETTDEEGVVHYFEKLEEFEYEGTRYALLIYHGTAEELKAEAAAMMNGKGDSANGNGKAPHDEEGHVHGPGCSHSHDEDGDDEDEDAYEEEIVLMRMVPEDDTFIYEGVEDEDEFERVLKHLETLDPEMYAFTGGGDDDEDGEGIRIEMKGE